MLTFITKKIVWLPISLFIISCVCFGLSKLIPYDPVDFMIQLETGDNQRISEDAYNRMYQRLNLDKPNFYVCLNSKSFSTPNDLILRPEEKVMIEKLFLKGYPLAEGLELIKNSEVNINDLNSKAAFSLPNLSWHGSDNQYHIWLRSILKGDFGVSYLDGRPVIKKILEALKWTMCLVIISIVLSFFFGISLGLLNSKHQEKNWLRGLNLAAYFIYVMPLFWLATLALVFLTTSDYGRWTNLFPSPSAFVDTGEGFWVLCFKYGKVLILPILLMVLNSLSYISRQMYSSLENESNKLYAQTALTKGLTEDIVTKKHKFRNALLPMITLFTSALPSALGGSVIIETIFNIPGMGRLMYDSISMADWHVVYAIVIITAVVTFFAFVLADILYFLVNPKIKYVQS